MGYILNGLLRAIEDIVSKYFFIVFQSAWRTIAGGSWHCTGGSDQDHPQEKEMLGCLMRLQMAEKRREAKGKWKRKDIPIWMQSSKEYEGEIRKPSSEINAKK